MTEVRIGALRYDLVADTEKFEKDMFASRSEIQASKKAFNESRTPAERYGREIEKLNNLRRKGLIDAKSYGRSIEKARKSFNDASRSADRFAKSQQKVNSRSAMSVRNLKNLAGALGLVHTARMALSQVREEIVNVDAIAKSARKLGLFSDELVGIQFAAERLSGMGAKQVETAMQRMTRRISEAAAGTGEAQAALKELGLDARKLNLAGPSESFRMIADRIKAVENPTDRLRLAFKLFDSEGAALVNTLAAGSDELDKMATEAEKLGLTFSGMDAAALEDVNDSITDLKDSWVGLRREMVIGLAPAFEELARLLRGAVGQYRDARRELAGDTAEQFKTETEFSNILRRRRGQEEVRVIGGDPTEFHKKRREAIRETSRRLKAEREEQARLDAQNEQNRREDLGATGRAAEDALQTAGKALGQFFVGNTDQAKQEFADLAKNGEADGKVYWDGWVQAAKDAQLKLEIDQTKQRKEEAEEDAKRIHEFAVGMAEQAKAEADKALKDFEKAQPKAFSGRGAVGAQRGSREEFAILRDLKRQKNDSAKRAAAEARAETQRERLITAQESAATSLDAIKNKEPAVGGV